MRERSPNESFLCFRKRQDQTEGELPSMHSPGTTPFDQWDAGSHWHKVRNGGCTSTREPTSNGGHGRILHQVNSGLVHRCSPHRVWIPYTDGRKHQGFQAPTAQPTVDGERQLLNSICSVFVTFCTQKHIHQKHKHTGTVTNFTVSGLSLQQD